MLVTRFITAESRTLTAAAGMISSRKSRGARTRRPVFALHFTFNPANQKQNPTTLTQILRLDSVVMFTQTNKVNIGCRLPQVYLKEKKKKKNDMR